MAKKKAVKKKFVIRVGGKYVTRDGEDLVKIVRGMAGSAAYKFIGIFLRDGWVASFTKNGCFWRDEREDRLDLVTKLTKPIKDFKPGRK